MLDSLTEEALMRACDGESTPEERARLQARIDTDADVRATWEALEAASRVLRSVDLADPPEAWKQQVIREIRMAAPRDTRVPSHATANPSALFAALRSWFASRPGVAFAAGAACALVIGLALRPGALVDPSTAPGAFLNSGRIAAGAPHTSTTLQLQAGSVSVVATKSGAAVILEVEAISSLPVEIDIESSAGALWMSAGESTPPVGQADAVGRVRMEVGRVRIAHQGHACYRLACEPGGPLVVRLSAADERRETRLEMPGS